MRYALWGGHDNSVQIGSRQDRSVQQKLRALASMHRITMTFHDAFTPAVKNTDRAMKMFAEAVENRRLWLGPVSMGRSEAVNIKCRARISDECYDGTPCETIYGTDSMVEDGLFDGESVICDPCYLKGGQPSLPYRATDPPSRAEVVAYVNQEMRITDDR